MSSNNINLKFGHRRMPLIGAPGIMLRPNQHALFALTTLVGVVMFGCVSALPRAAVLLHGVDQMTLRYNDGPQCHGLPYVEGSINGVRGAFVIDTGANKPVLTMTAVRRCGISLSENATGAVDTDAGVIKVKRVRDVKVELAPEVTVHWSNVYVDPRDYPWLGLIDYETLKACHATVNSSDKTITIRR